MIDPEQYSIVFSPKFEKVLKSFKKKKPEIFEQLARKILKISDDPMLGKPLRNVLKNYRRVHIGSYVLLYEVYNFEIRFLDFEHHDKIYKK